MGPFWFMLVAGGSNPDHVRRKSQSRCFQDVSQGVCDGSGPCLMGCVVALTTLCVCRATSLWMRDRESTRQSHWRRLKTLECTADSEWMHPLSTLVLMTSPAHQVLLHGGVLLQVVVGLPPAGPTVEQVLGQHPLLLLLAHSECNVPHFPPSHTLLPPSLLPPRSSLTPPSFLPSLLPPSLPQQNADYTTQRMSDLSQKLERAEYQVEP